MAAEMGLTTLPGEHVSLDNAAYWLRQHLNVPPECTIFEQFERHFNCRIEVQNCKDSWMQPNQVHFASAADLTAFLLRWS